MKYTPEGFPLVFLNRDAQSAYEDNLERDRKMRCLNHPEVILESNRFLPHYQYLGPENPVGEKDFDVFDCEAAKDKSCPEALDLRGIAS